MSPVVPSDALAAQKKKGNKKKKAKSKPNGDSTSTAPDTSIAVEEGDGDGDEDELNVKLASAGLDDATESTAAKQTNGSTEPMNALATNSQQATKDEPADPETADATSRLEAMSASRDALRLEVESLRRSLETITEKHSTELSSLQTSLADAQADKERLEQEKTELAEQFHEEREIQQTKLRETIKQVRVKLASFNEVQKENESLGERVGELEDREREREDHIEKLEKENKSREVQVTRMEEQILRLTEENRGYDDELTTLRRTQNDLFSQNQQLRNASEEMVALNRHLKEEANLATEEVEEWREQMEYHRSKCEQLEAVIAELEPLNDKCRDQERALESARDERARVDEQWQEKMTALHTTLKELDERATAAESEKETLTARLNSYEAEKLAELKKKDEELAEWRQKYIMEREAVKKVQKENRRLAKINPEDYIAKQIVTSHLTKFLSLDRADPTRFQILQALAGMLNFSDGDLEKAGLQRPGAATTASSLRVPAFSPLYRTPSTPNLAQSAGFNFSGEGAPPVPDTPRSGLWGFMKGRGTESRPGSVTGSLAGTEATTQAESEKDYGSASRSASVSSVPPK